MLLVFFALSALLGLAGSAWIDSLYWRGRSLLSFPAAGRPCWRLPLLAGGFALLGALLSGIGLSPAGLAARLLLGAFLLLTMVTDWEQQLIFDRMQLPFAMLSLPFMWWQGNMADCLLAALAGGGGFLLLALLTRGGIGGGDIKLMAVLGLWLGTNKLLAVALGGFILSGAVAALMLLSGHLRRGQAFAYSPYFSLFALWLLMK